LVGSKVGFLRIEKEIIEENLGNPKAERKTMTKKKKSEPGEL
jgi:hypothetical protein